MFLYKVKYNNNEFNAYTIKEIADRTGKSMSCIYRIIRGTNSYKKKSSEELKNIQIIKKIILTPYLMNKSIMYKNK